MSSYLRTRAVFILARVLQEQLEELGLDLVILTYTTSYMHACSSTVHTRTTRVCICILYELVIMMYAYSYQSSSMHTFNRVVSMGSQYVFMFVCITNNQYAYSRVCTYYYWLVRGIMYSFIYLLSMYVCTRRQVPWRKCG